MTATIVLQPRLNLDVVQALSDEISACEGKDLEFDASQVTHLGTLCLQVLLAAARDWAVAGAAFRMVRPSESCLAQLALFGLTPETFAGGNV